ncbi:hypothetical protein [Microcoleus sp. FACHB-672]|nr:hypothetical protein [Microcoleus sp. FACHB-672]MBD2043997.1 hypothetical protein [Microcoleus sp. FACHB-672]
MYHPIGDAIILRRLLILGACGDGCDDASASALQIGLSPKMDEPAPAIW